LRDRLAASVPDVTVQTRGQFVSQESALIRDMSADLMKIMTIVALVIALAVIALLLFTTTLAHLRDYGIVKALGGRPKRLIVTVLAQALWAVALAVAVAVLLALLLGAVVGRISDNVQVIIEAATVARVAVQAAVVAAIGALVPLGRVLRLDPSAVFRRST
jgi:putative ABC transport system permease protein